MNYQWDFAFLLRYTPLFWRGVLVTLAYTAGTIFLGLIIGLLIGLGRLSRSKLANIPLIAFIEAFRCTPLLVQIVWFYYALPVLLNIQIPATAAAVMVLSCYTGAFYAEIFRGGIISIESGQWDAARALGLRRWAMMRKVILPQAVKRMIPPFVNQSITQLKNTSLVSTIAVPDLLYQGTLITADTYRPLEVYTVVALIYFAMLFPSTLLAQAYERRLAKDR
jgi:polar amino acid transport system permease protein